MKKAVRSERIEQVGASERASGRAYGSLHYAYIDFTLFPPNRASTPIRKPTGGVLWDLVDERKMEEIPALARLKEIQAGQPIEEEVAAIHTKCSEQGRVTAGGDIVESGTAVSDARNNVAEGFSAKSGGLRGSRVAESIAKGSRAAGGNACGRGAGGRGARAAWRPRGHGRGFPGRDGQGHGRGRGSAMADGGIS